ncbi:uncharacterized protein STEHIDRAFT_165519 [Stereum hirsutum FP-91666 SS1]|uniref:uncharacterized protein n=1 Tax=Stereum hirsutum (strain FP-91666) TaxID=721885 RepID=UPI000440ECF2|nr:uncharacterized protein STEHIDRAFT_165519 [Stereum hirsutum FP-91666 SS1]EIM91132.1 hypothetical protein STEHIDRAFT_165519 [Stereum hirsutum FP-91666 SS1]
MSRLAEPNGHYIYRSDPDIKKIYKLSPSDLDSILPISDTPNPHGGRNNVRIYNLCDVVKLSLELNVPTSPPSSPPPASGSQSSNPALAVQKGAKILRTNAMKEYKLTGIQLDRLKPISIEPNPHRSTGTMRYYNLCDVKDLAQKVNSAAASPTKKYVRKRYAPY